MIIKEETKLRHVNNIFWEKLVKKIQNDRVTEGMETTTNKLSLPRVTKLLYNFFEANPQFYKHLVEVKVKSQSN